MTGDRSELALYSDAEVANVRSELLEDSPDRGIRTGLIVVAIFFGLFLGWAALARLDASATGDGAIAVLGSRQTVQHRDGGIVSGLKVREGQHVKAGQILLELSGDEVRAQERALAASVIDLQAQRARLEAEVQGTAIHWPDSFKAPAPENVQLVQNAVNLQLKQHEVRRQALAASGQVSSDQAAAINAQSAGIRAQQSAMAEQRASMEAQLALSRELAAKGYVSMNNIRAMERQVAALRGSGAEYGSRAASAREQIGQVRSQYLELKRKSSEDSAAMLRDAQFQLNDMMPKWQAAQEQLKKLEIRAPVTGKVVGLTIFSVGGVISPGQPLMDIVPDKAPLIIKARFSPQDIDGVREGGEAEVKFMSIHESDLPVIMGTVKTVSADTIKDEVTQREYFSSEILVPESEVAKLRNARGEDTGIRPGVPVQVFVRLRKRSALQYFLDPLTQAFRYSLHER
ncbi:MAG: HlyD family type I secretion periplasmic adaptor subunit [Sphingobium sp.]|nr:HlyD family type I secretion periplasmic adaptor subunit [Sphingobium sp.]